MNRRGKKWKWWQIFFGSKITVNGDCIHEIKRCFLLGRKAMTNLDSILKCRDITLDKGLYSQSYGFSSSHLWMWELDHKEGWVLKNWCFQIVVQEKTLENPLDSMEMKTVFSKGSQPLIFTRRTMLKLNSTTLATWCEEPTHWKRPYVGNDWKREEKMVTEDEMVG